jgi:hypothetical protein
LIVNKSSFKSKNKIISNLATLIEKELWVIFFLKTILSKTL